MFWVKINLIQQIKRPALNNLNKTKLFISQYEFILIYIFCLRTMGFFKKFHFIHYGIKTQKKFYYLFSSLECVNKSIKIQNYTMIFIFRSF